jgi:ABC-type bacteriocin/lantibiotic exporter with double-glycine peptidase domain
LLLALFLGCAGPLASQESAGVWLDVPFVKQSKDGCGSAAISMVLQYWNEHGAKIETHRSDPQAIQKELYSSAARGIHSSDMERYLKESGFRVFPVDGKWTDLEEQLRKGRPVIVSLRPNGGAPLHYAVVTGMDWEKGAVFLHDPARGKLLRIERTEFEKEWRANRNWMLLAVPEKTA